MSSLITPLIWAIVIAVALRPPVRRGIAGYVVFVLTMGLNELPLLFLVVIVASVAAQGVERPGGPLEIVWWLLWAFVLVGLAWIQVRAGQTRAAFEDGLAAALGRGWESAGQVVPLVSDQAADEGHRTLITAWLAGILLPFRRRLRGVERTRNVAYGPEPAHKLDIYRSGRAGRPRPIALHFHEGGFVQGGKSREAVTLLNQLAAHGWLCLSANYRLRAGAAFPNPLVDAKRAIAWAREHATELGADAGNVFLVGGSAGGHIAINAALTPNDARFQPGFEGADTSVCGAVSIYGYLGPRSEDPTSFPAELAGPDAPPLLLVQGANDTALPWGKPRAWAGSLRRTSGGRVAYVELAGTQHAFDLFASVRARLCANGIESFLRWALAAASHEG